MIKKMNKRMNKKINKIKMMINKSTQINHLNKKKKIKKITQ